MIIDIFFQQFTTLSYSNNFLASITGPTATTLASATYDAYNRIRTVTDSEGYTVTIDYDALNRTTVVTYPDGTYTQTVYDKLDAVRLRDRLGRWTVRLYDERDRLTVVVDPLNHFTQYLWCLCGGLNGLVDPSGHTTTWNRDLQGRVTSKVYPDGTMVTNAYENTTSRLHSKTDAKGQTTQYTYSDDNDLQQVEYLNAVIPTAPVSFTYDANYNRVVTMQDTNGVTTYGYNPVTVPPVLGAGRLASIAGTITNSTITYAYDQLGRVTGRAINSVTNSVGYDSLGRVVTVTNVLGGFVYTYTNSTARPSSMSYPNGQTTLYSYFGNTGDQRLKEIWNQTSTNSTLSKFDYTYDANGEIQTWTQQADGGDPVQSTFGYDSDNQLLSAVLQDTTTSGILSRFAYTYDTSGNRTSERIDGTMTGSAYNNVNQLTSQTVGGPLQFSGSVDKPVTNLTVGGNTALLDTNRTSFTGYATVGVGTNTVSVVAQDFDGNSSTNNYQVVVVNGVTQTLGYDLNGNLTNMTSAVCTNSYEWDAADRLVAINNTTNRTEFTYDGYGRRTEIIEKTSGTITSGKKFVWTGIELCEARDSTGSVVSNRFFPQGEQISGTAYYYTRDHLGSIREMIDSSGSIRAQYNYDPYGRLLKVSGDLEATLTFTGYYYHRASGLYLSLYRAYSGELGRWLSHDPSGEKEGFNLYAFVADNVINLVDPLGLSFWNSFLQGFANGVATGFVIVGVAAIAVAAGVAAPVVAGALLVGAGIGLGLGFANLIIDTYECGSVNYDYLGNFLGNLTGGLAVGGLTTTPLLPGGGGLDVMLSPPDSSLNGWDVPGELDMFWQWDSELSISENFWNAMGTGPTGSSVGGAIGLNNNVMPGLQHHCPCP